MKSVLCMLVGCFALWSKAWGGSSYAVFPFFQSCDEAFILQISAWCQARDVYGFQIAPVRNTAHGTAFVQLGGSNSAFDCWGLQAGVHNDCARTLRGVQLGVYNETGRLRGFQIGVVNSALQATGFQIGLMNMANSAGGFQIGLMNATRESGDWGNSGRFLFRLGLFNMGYYKTETCTCWPLMTLEW